MTKPLVVFDLDGTLIDTAPDLIGTLNAVFAREGLPPVPYDQARTLIGGGAKLMIARGLEAEGRRASPAQLEKLFADFIDHYSAHIADQSKPFPGLEEALDQLTEDGFALAVCTNKLEGLSVKLLTALGLANRFVKICGQDTFGVQKPDPEMLRRTVAAAGGHPERSIMVGDSETDIRTAQRANVPVIAVDFGYTPQPVAEFGPDLVISHFRNLRAAISELGRQRG
jgi:phosphoglycolate phosphatase